MKINSKNSNVQKMPFKGMIPERVLQDLKRQNTTDSIKLLNSCKGFNAVYRGAENLNPDKIARELADKFNIGSDFGNNPLFAAFSALTVNIFRKLNFPLPSNVLLKDLSGTWYSKCLGICCTSPFDADIYRKFGGSFPLKSVIMNATQDWSSIQDYMLEAKRRNHTSTGHFLDVFIHEFMHSAHLTNLEKRYGAKEGGKFMRKFQKDFTNKDTIAMIKNETSNYGATKPCEMIAEEMTELVVDSLNPRTLLPDEMIFRMNRLKEPFEMDKLIDACWNGDFKQVETFRRQKNSLVEALKKAMN